MFPELFEKNKKKNKFIQEQLYIEEPIPLLPPDQEKKQEKEPNKRGFEIIEF